MRKYLREAEVTYRRTSTEVPAEFRRTITNSVVVFELLRSMLGNRMTESVVVVALTGRHEIVGVHEVARGGLSACPVVPADIFRFPLVAGAAAIVVAHNHPSGDPSPSREDVELTERLVRAGGLLGLQVLDHLVICDQRYTSLMDEGLMPGL